ncbi:hypothetical protein KR093_001223 [Drosophila rubida]|uniref:Uncharacterized protein n=1 Tax=Drosophila rubida TaxID=30044 RepID=A0AAD4JSQ6_9MUSC|nr:hypothetical protein KR093_001223 [Drosophila rubida]
MLRQICTSCPLLQQLYLRNESHADMPLNIACVANLEDLRRLQLPLMLQTPSAVGKLQNLRHLTLQRQQLWPDMDWLFVVREIIHVKRYELQRLSFDGSWLSRPLDLSLLQLHKCFALKELLLSNCNLADPRDRLTLPLSCVRFSLKDCTVNKLHSYVRGTTMLHLLELNKCQLTNDDGKFIMGLLKQRQQLPILYPLRLRFSGSFSLRLELIGWKARKPELWEDWLQVEEVLGNGLTSWKQQRAAFNMSFGAPLQVPPDLKNLF